jgi:hypothetical protein
VLEFIVSWFMYYLSCDLCVLCNSSMSVALGCTLRMNNVLIDFIDTVSTLENTLERLSGKVWAKLEMKPSFGAKLGLQG